MLPPTRNSCCGEIGLCHRPRQTLLLSWFVTNLLSEFSRPHHDPAFTCDICCCRHSCAVIYKQNSLRRAQNREPRLSVSRLPFRISSGPRLPGPAEMRIECCDAHLSQALLRFIPAENGCDCIACHKISFVPLRSWVRRFQSLILGRH